MFLFCHPYLRIIKTTVFVLYMELALDRIFKIFIASDNVQRTWATFSKAITIPSSQRSDLTIK